MSNSCLFMKSGFVRAPLQNGIGRYVCQIQRIVFKFCKSHGASRGMRDFIEKNLLNFAESNPGIAVYVKPRRHRAPVLRAEYLNGEIGLINCSNYTNEEILKWLTLLKTQNGNSESIRLRKLWHTENPSIQGPWTPFTFKHPSENLLKFPDEEYLQPPNMAKSATDILLEMYEKQKADNSDSPKV